MMPARAVALKKLVFDEPLSVISCVSFVSAPPLTR
jgi:hypothetical protein